jgi:predicted KAP-like P-loop ATPase
MDNNFSSDKPISQKHEDMFQRYEFAKRIANTIINRNNEECIVIGIYGSWGEGKTSVINFIGEEINQIDNIISIKFNPWRYNEENSLLEQFFQKLATSLDANLKTKGEKFGSLLSKYGGLLKVDIPILGVNLGDIAEAAGESMSEVDIETLKERIGELLKACDSKVVIFIDDIDRLEKVEIHSIFRLVKLTADFLNTTYVLSFDDDMVSAAIGERFGAGNQKSGQNFLEKIIQVPLRIPMARPEALRQYCFQMLENVLQTNNISLSEEENMRFVSEFDNILTKLDTPRLAVRYVNSLSFSIPLLAGEVNLVDLMLIEAVKIFYPRHYEFIKLNPEYFIRSYYEDFSTKTDAYKVNTLKGYLEELGHDLTKKQNISIQNLLIQLFPVLKKVFKDLVIHDYDKLEKDWFKKKRIVSPKYFSKYFSYVVINGEISDIEFFDFLKTVSTKSIEEITKSIIAFVEHGSPDNFLQKIRIVEEEIVWEDAIKISKAISATSNIFPKSENFFFNLGYHSPNSQAALFIYQIIKKYDKRDEQLLIANELTIEAKHFEFAMELNRWMRIGDTPELQLFNIDEYQYLAKSLIERAQKESQESSIFEKFPLHTASLFESWFEINKTELFKYISNILKKDKSKIVDLLRSLTPNGYNTMVVGPYKLDFKKAQFEFLILIFDKKKIENAISDTFKESELNAEDVIWTQEGEKNNQSDLNIVRQFRFWLNQQEAESKDL